MRAVLCSVFAILPMFAHAGGHDWVTDGAAKVTIESEVEIPLYRDQSSSSTPQILVTIPGEKEDKRVLVSAALGAAVNTVSKGEAKEMGWKLRTSKKVLWFTHPGLPMGKEITWTIAPEIKIGSAVLEEVRFVVTDSGPMRISFQTLPEVTVALLPSKGTVKIVDSGKADTLLEEVGDIVQGEVHPASKSTHVHGRRIGAVPGYTSFPVSIGEQSAEVVLMLSDRKSYFSLPASESAEEAAVINGVQWREGSLTLGSQSFPEISFVDGAPSAAAFPLWSEGDGVLGYDFLLNKDVAYDANTGRMAMKTTEAPTWSAVGALQLELARDVFDQAKKSGDSAESQTAASEATATEDGEDTPKADDSGRFIAFASALAKEGMHVEALEILQGVKDSGTENCGLHYAIAKSQWLSGKWKESREPAVKAGVLRDQWQSQELATRIRVQDKKKVDDSVFTTVQDGKCDGAWSLVAASHLALGEHESVMSTFEEKMDLDADLASLWGLSLLVQNLPAEANGAYRSALNLSSRGDAAVRIGLGFANARTGKSKLASLQLESVLETRGPLSLSTAIEGLALSREIEGMTAAGFADRLVGLHPNSAVAWLAYGYDAMAGGDETRIALFSKNVEPALHRDRELTFNESEAACLQDLASSLLGTKKESEAGPAGGVLNVNCAVAGLLQAANADDGAAVEQWRNIVFALAPTTPMGILPIEKVESGVSE